MKRRVATTDEPIRNIAEQCGLIAPRLRQLRGCLGATQAELASQIVGLGVPMHRGTLAKIEAGIRPLQLAEALAYAELANVSVEELISPNPIEFVTQL